MKSSRFRICPREEKNIEDLKSVTPSSLLKRKESSSNFDDKVGGGRKPTIGTNYTE